MSKTLSSQISDRNFLQASGFKFSIQKAPKVTYFGNSVNVPGISLGVANQPNYLKNIPVVGDMMEFNDLNLRFLIDENLENYREIQNWMRGIGYPESLDQVYDLQKEGPIRDYSQLNLYSDGALQILSSINRPVFAVNFRDMFPTSLSDIRFDSTLATTEYLTADVTFKYSIYNIETVDCC
jgi:hypothetical protein